MHNSLNYLVAAVAVIGGMSPGPSAGATILHAGTDARPGSVYRGARSHLAIPGTGRGVTSPALPNSPSLAESVRSRPGARAAASLARNSADATAAFNPVTGSQGFAVFVKGSAALNATAVAGPVALGGNLTFGSGTFSVATQTAGSFTAAGDSRPTGLLVGGNINWAGSSSSGTVSIQNSTYVKIGDLTGSTVAQSGSAATHIVPTGHGYSSSPQIAEVVNQPTSSVNQSGLIDFTGTFSTFAGNSSNLAACASTIALDQANGTPLPLPLSSGTNAYITLNAGVQNILNITAANLANISILQFRNLPTATMPLVINVDTSGVGNNFSWTLPNINGFQNSAAPYLLWNFSSATQLTINGSQTVPGTIYAPGTTVNDSDGNGINGGVIAAAYAQGASGGSPNGGQVLSAPFATTVQGCATAQLTIANSASVGSTVPGGTVHYTVTATNSGQVAYTGATFTESLSDVVDDAVYNNDAAASAGSVSFASPNLTWTGNLAPGAVATVTFSVTVNNPDTGNKVLASTVASVTAGSNCAAGSTDPRCSVSVPVAVLTIAMTASPPTTTPGAVVSYTITVTNSGQFAYTGASFTDSLSGVLDDASYNADGTATAGSLSFASPNLTWTGSLAIGATATITYSVTVNNPDTGNKSLASTITSGTAGSNCASGNTDSRCASTVTVLVPGLTTTLTATVSSTTPGSVVGYTVTATNTGQTAYSSASFTDSLAGVLDDASYDGDAAASSGSVSFASPNLTWTGSLAIGASATITFSVTVHNPDTGDKLLTITIVSATAGSNCPSGGTDPRCSNSIPVLVPGLSIAASTDVAATVPGGVVHYTVTVTNSGQTAYTAATFTMPLGGVLDDAAYNGNAAASAGSVSFASPSLTWTGSLATGASATVTFSVTVNNPDTGDHVLSSTVTSATPGASCPAGGGGAAACTATVNVAQLTIVNSANVSSTTPGSVVRFTATFTNAGQVPYTGITITTNAADVFDDAVPNGDQTATSGVLSINGTSVSWTGSIPVGGSVTVTGTVTVNNPDTGNKLLASTITTAAAGSNCPSGTTDPRCSVAVPVLVPALTIVQAADTTTAVPGQVIGYTVTITDTGPTPYAGAVVNESLADMLDDVTYDNDAAAAGGTVSYTAPVITWTGDLAPGGSATVTFSVTVNNPDAGDKLVIAAVSSAATGSTCPPGSITSACRSTIAVLTPGLTIVKTASTSTPVPGQQVTYTITVTDSGQTPYAGASFSDDLTGVLDDAHYNTDATTTAGTVSYAAPVISWTGNLNPGDTAVITYSVTISNPDTGDLILANTVISPTPGSNCPATGPDPRCTVTLTIVSAATLTITNTAAAPSAVPGGTVHYTITVANSGLTDYTGATLTDDLTGITGDAAYNGDAAITAGTGTLAYTAPDLTWTGTVPASGSVTITFTATVHNPDTGGHLLTTTITTTSPGSNCASGSGDPRCTSTVTVSQLTIDFTASTPTTTPGAVVAYTATLDNTGQTPYLGISVATDATGIADDATGNGDQVASSGTLSVGTTGAVWTGDIPVGQTVTITSSVTVDNPDTGDHVLTATAVSTAPGNNCPPGGTDPRCTPVTDVLTPALTISQSASTTTAVPGQQVGLTLTITNTGQTPYTGVTVTDSLAQMLDDATYDNDAAATAPGTLTYTAPVLAWTGDLPVDGSVVITFTVTVNNPDTGDKLVIADAASAATGSTCPPATTTAPCRITVPVLTPALTITKTASVPTATPGSTVTYTITIDNTGQTPYTAASVTDDLTGVLADAAYDNDATATATGTGTGTVSYAAPILTWTGSLNPGDTATITYTVTVLNPDTGTGTLTNTATSAAAGSNCPDDSTDPRCTATVDVAQLTIANSASVSSTTPGSVVDYTITITDAGQTSYTGATVTDPLDDVLDDAAYNSDGTASDGSVTFTSPDLAWTGSLAPGQTATITFSVTVNNPDTGNKILASTINSTAAGNNCPAGGTDPRCTATVTVLIPALTITKTAAVSTTTPGSTFGYTITVDDTGPTAYAAATITDPLDGVLDDATYNDDAMASTGTATYSSQVLTWTGSLAPGQTATISYTVTVNNPDTGDKLPTNTVSSTNIGSNCLPGSTDPACTATVAVLVPALTITKTATVSTVTPGSAVGYTITVADTGQTSYTAAQVTDSLAGVLGDATYGGGATASTGTVSYAAPVLTWTGDLAPGDTATISYSVTVNNPDTGGRFLTNTAVSAAPGSTCPSGSANPACSVTVAVMAGELSISAPANAFLGTAFPGGAIDASLGTVQVTDDRGFGAGWTATVSATDFTTGGATTAETIPADDVSYSITALTSTSGTANFTFTPATILNAGPQPIVSATSVGSNNSASWNPAISLTVPPDAVGGPYTATITESVS